jgi:hypothetical protein
MLSITTKFGTAYLPNSVKLIAEASSLNINVINDEFISHRVLRVLGVENIVECDDCIYTLYDAGHAELTNVDGNQVRRPMIEEVHITTISVVNCSGNTFINIYPENFDININYI